MKQPFYRQFFVCVLLIAFVAASLRAAEQPAITEIKIDAPASPVQTREYVMLAVHNLSDADLPKAQLTWEPKEGVVLLPFKTWGGQAILLFSANRPGKYAIAISVNGWRQITERAVEEAKIAKVDDALLKELEAIVNKLEAKYPYSLGSCVVEVAGQVPPPPDPIPVPTPGKKLLIILRETGDSTPDLARLLNNLRQGPIADQLKQHDLLILDKDAKTPDGQPVPMVQSYLRQLGSTPLPVLIIDAPSSFADDETLYKGPLPADAQSVLDLVKKSGG